ncbi:MULTISPECIES: hypothetical protein [Pseudomonas putida group]|uniref:hypothetical protein n=1 Tax=Pseudomonas putida group TaxID=136845 RepID=UPI0018AC0921|nr:hypothetical protein [Pseudomonas fulva]MBF8776262.1 hypothetical protein [Pseudomonas fulva]
MPQEIFGDVAKVRSCSYDMGMKKPPVGGFFSGERSIAVQVLGVRLEDLTGQNFTRAGRQLSADFVGSLRALFGFVRSMRLANQSNAKLVRHDQPPVGLKIRKA